MTRAELRAHVRERERGELHCWHSDDDYRVCMAARDHGGNHSYVDPSRIVVESDGANYLARVRP